MRIVSINPAPIAELLFLNAGRRAGQFYEDRLPVLEAVVDRLPGQARALVATADLQGRERFEDQPGSPLRLLGEVLPRWLDEQVFPCYGDPPASEMAALLAGDFYTVPGLDRRGGSGDVTTVWETFADAFQWVAGVAGNHDVFGTSPAARPRPRQGMKYLDGETVEIDGLRIAGIGGIIGNRQRPRRRDESEYLALLQSLLPKAPDILILHDGPDAPLPGCRGSARVRELLESSRPVLVIRGHAHWDTPLVELPNGTQVLNVDARVVVLRGAERP